MRKLTSDQQRAIDYFESPLILTGPAGSGKTTVLAQKIARILEEKESDRILVVAGSKKLVKDLEGWVGQLVGEDVKNVRFDPLERVGLEWIRFNASRLGLHRHFVVYDHIEQLRILIELGEIEPASGQPTLAPRDALQQIRRLKLSGITAESFSDNDGAYSPWLHDLYRAYQAYLSGSQAIDREDIIPLACRLVAEYPEVVTEIAARYRYWIVDQAEDLSPVHIALIVAIAPALAHLTVCGDSEQAVGLEFGIRGDAIQAIGQQLPHSHTVQLSRVFRAGNAIVDVARALRKTRKSTSNDDFVVMDDKSLVYFLAFDEQEEARYVVDEITMIRREEMLSLNDFCILYRTQSQAYFFEEQLRQQGVRFRSLGRSAVYANSEIRDLILYLRVLFNPADRQAISQLLALPPFQLDELAITEVIRNIPNSSGGILDLQGKSFKMDADIDAKLIGLIDLLVHWNGLLQEDPDVLAAVIVSQIADDSGYRMLLEDENTLESLERLQTIDEFIGMAVERQWSVEQLLNDIAVTLPDDAELMSGDAVNLMPLRHAKGYEFPCVFVCGLEEGLIPHYSAQFQPDALDEERRLLYIGLTRGKRQVVLTSAFRRSMFGAEWYDDISRFVKELPRGRLACFFSDRMAESHEMLIDRMGDEGFHIQTWLPHTLTAEPEKEARYQVGEVVEHPNWGRGVIQHIEGVDDKVILHIQFGDNERKLMAKYADVIKL